MRISRPNSIILHKISMEVNKVKIFPNSSIINNLPPSKDNIPLRRDNFSTGLTNSTTKKEDFNEIEISFFKFNPIFHSLHWSKK